MAFQNLYQPTDHFVKVESNAVVGRRPVAAKDQGLEHLATHFCLC